jgi:hypothetical protein
MESIKSIESIVGTLSDNSKMPGFSWEIPAEECRIGSKLRSVAGSVCAKCYALKGFYIRYPNVKIAQYKRLEALKLGPEWVRLMTDLISRKVDATVPFFRWFGSGDLQSLEHLEMIVQVCRNLPAIKFWLPTREIPIISAYQAKHPGPFPSNLNVRVSGNMVNGDAPQLPHCTMSVVSTHDRSDALTCQAPANAGHCGDCRACWNPEVLNINYHQH